jgi:AcrR family transcriptional regulator
MARPAHADSAATQNRILAAAMRMFGEEGTGNVSIRRIAAAAGVSLATVHHYFGSKEQLYAACIRSMYAELEDLRGDVSRAFEQSSSQESLVEQTVRAAFRFAWDHRGALRLLMRTIIDAGHMDPQHRAAVHLPFLDEASKLLARAFGKKRSELRLTIQSMMHLVVRYALTDAGELAQIAGMNDERKALDAIEDHLVGVALSLLAKEQ